jgi:hypothetical protein
MLAIVVWICCQLLAKHTLGYNEILCNICVVYVSNMLYLLWSLMYMTSTQYKEI